MTQPKSHKVCARDSVTWCMDHVTPSHASTTSYLRYTIEHYRTQQNSYRKGVGAWGTSSGVPELSYPWQGTTTLALVAKVSRPYTPTTIIPPTKVLVIEQHKLNNCLTNDYAVYMFVSPPHVRSDNKVMKQFKVIHPKKFIGLPLRNCKPIQTSDLRLNQRPLTRSLQTYPPNKKKENNDMIAFNIRE